MRWLMQSNTGGVAQRDDAVSGLREGTSHGEVQFREVVVKGNGAGEIAIVPASQRHCPRTWYFPHAKGGGNWVADAIHPIIVARSAVDEAGERMFSALTAREECDDGPEIRLHRQDAS